MNKVLLLFFFSLFFLGVFAETCTWTEIDDLDNKEIRDILFAPNGEIFVLVSGSGFPKHSLYKSVDNGDSWSHLFNYRVFISDNLKDNYYSGSEVFVTSNNILYASGINLDDKSVVFYSEDRGTTWHLTNFIDETSPVDGIFEASSGNIFLEIHNADLYKKTPSLLDLTWNPLTTIPDASYLRFLSQLNNNDIYQLIHVHGIDKIYKTSNEGISWDYVGDMPTDFEAKKLIEKNNGDLLVSGRIPEMGIFNILIYKSTNHGATWNLIKHFEESNDATGIEVASDGTFFIGTSYIGKLFKSINQGETWDEIPLPSEFDSIQKVKEINDGQLIITFVDAFEYSTYRFSCINAVPIANAGADQETEISSLVNLSGTAIDADGDELTYSWEQVSGTTVFLTNENTLTSSFNAPSSTATLEFKLTVSDGIDSSTDNVVVRVIAAAECSNGETQNCSIDGCDGTKSCNTSGTWSECEKNDKTCESKETECTSDNDCALNEECQKTECYPIKCSDNQEIKNHKCVDKPKDVASKDIETILVSVRQAIDDENPEQAVELLLLAKETLSDSSKDKEIQGLLNQALGELASGDLSDAKKTVVKIESMLEELSKKEDTSGFPGSIWIIALVVIVILGIAGGIVYWKMKGKKII